MREKKHESIKPIRAEAKTNPKLLELRDEKKRLFERVPMVTYGSENNGEFLSFADDAYNTKYMIMAKESPYICKDTPNTIVCSYMNNKIFKDKLRLIFNDFKNVKLPAAFNKFLDDMERNLRITISSNCLDILAEQGNNLCIEALIISLQNIISLLQDFLLRLQEMDDDTSQYHTLVKMHHNAISMLRDTINTMVVEKRNHLSYDSAFNGYILRSFVVDAKKKHTTTISDQEAIRLAIREFEIANNINDSSTRSTYRLYYMVKNILLASFGELGKAEDAELPYYMFVLSNLDGFGFFHAYHEQLLAVYDYIYTSALQFDMNHITDIDIVNARDLYDEF